MKHLLCIGLIIFCFHPCKGQEEQYSSLIFELKKQRYSKTFSDKYFKTNDRILCPEIRFVFGPHAALDEINRDTFNLIATFLAERPNLIFEIGCHTDSRGTKEGNEILSENRAKTLYLMFIKEYGIDSLRLRYRGYGENDPLIHDSLIQPYRQVDKVMFERLHQLNRRTELKVINRISNIADTLVQLNYSKTLSDSVFIKDDRIKCPGIRFQLAHYNLIEESLDSIQLVAQFLKNNPRLIVEIGVHTDSRGSAYSSRRLSHKRAETIYNLLVEKYDIDSTQIRYKGYEDAILIIPDDLVYLLKETDLPEYERRHQINRRVELRIIGVLEPSN